MCACVQADSCSWQMLKSLSLITGVILRLITIDITGQMLKVRGQQGNTGKKTGMERRPQEMPQIEILIDASAAAELWSACKHTHTHTHTMPATHRIHDIYQPVSDKNSTHSHCFINSMNNEYAICRLKCATEAISEVKYIPDILNCLSIHFCNISFKKMNVKRKYK